MNSHVYRRHFLRTSLQAGAVVSGLGLLANRLQAIEPLQRSGSARFLLSLAAYSFRDSFKTKDLAHQLDLFKFVDFCADHGCDGAELTSYYFPKELSVDYLIQL